jgi:hypothetical protein
MKYKEQSLNKVSKIQNKIRALEIALNRGHSIKEINVIMDELKEQVSSLNEMISIENDQW